MSRIEAPKYPILDEIKVPEDVLANWQVTVNLLAAIAEVPAALIMRVHAREIEVFVASQSPGNVYHHGEKAPLDIGLYCETVMSTRRELLVPNALKDPDWDHNPDIKLGMVSYCGLPLTWPTGEIFGTICSLDKRENAFNHRIHPLMERFRDSIQLSLAIIYHASVERQSAAAALRQQNETLRASNDELGLFNRTMVGRELRMIELKEEINELCRRLGEPPRHTTDQLQTDSVPGSGPAPAPPGGDGA
jgi:transcriptional regulator with GAF, ATPase, and Fis domain